MRLMKAHRRFFQFLTSIILKMQRNCLNDNLKSQKVSHDFLLIIILGKATILQQATNSAKRQIISQYILKK